MLGGHRLADLCRPAQPKSDRVQVQENMTSGYVSVAGILIKHAEIFTRVFAATREPFAALSPATG